MKKVQKGSVTLYNELTATQWDAGVAEAKAREIPHGYTWYPAPKNWGQLELYPTVTSPADIEGVEAAIEAAA